jgi:large subunit ribosomal protein L18
MQAQVDRRAIRRRVRHRIRRKVVGTAERPRVAVFRSQKHIYAQAIDDHGGRTVAHASSQDAAVRSKTPQGWNIAAAKAVGAVIGEKLKAAGVARAVFDRGGFMYHGRIKALAEALREAGVEL